MNVTPVATLDLERYLGLWYEIGRLPMKHEDDASRDVTAEYTLEPDGNVRVDNRCLDGQGEPTQALGRATPDEEHPGQLDVTFLPTGLRWIPWTSADYWVLRIDEGYSTALVGTPDHKYLWLLARAPHIDGAVEAAYLATAREQGFDLTPWIRTPQSGGRVTDAQLAAAE